MTFKAIFKGSIAFRGTYRYYRVGIGNNTDSIVKQHTLKSTPNVVTILSNVKLYFTSNSSKYESQIHSYDEKNVTLAYVLYYVDNEMGLMQESKGTLWQKQWHPYFRVWWNYSSMS